MIQSYESQKMLPQSFWLRGSNFFFSCLSENQISVYNLVRAIADVLHSAEPFQLIGGFELLRDALLQGHLSAQSPGRRGSFRAVQRRAGRRRGFSGTPSGISCAPVRSARERRRSLHYSELRGASARSPRRHRPRSRSGFQRGSSSHRSACTGCRFSRLSCNLFCDSKKSPPSASS